MSEQAKRANDFFSTRTFVIAFAIVEAVAIAWFIAGDVRRRADGRAAAASAAAAAATSRTPATRSTLP